jgi:serine/threonine-protein kinase
VAVGPDDELGPLARAYNALLADLREKEQVISFLKEGKDDDPPPSSPTDTTVALPAGDTLPSEDSSATTGPAPRGSPMRLDPGSLFSGRYRITSVLGKGGMGVVYRAHDEKLDEDVALKLLRPEVIERDDTLLDRFKLELKLARRITHRNVLRTHDFDEADGVPYISMEFVEGVMLKDLFESRGALPPGVGLRFAKQICNGLEAAHAQGVVHRDIKPQNMMILPETGEVKIMDFGIARVSEVKGGEGGLTTDGTVMGTPDYMPPEQAQGQPADYRSDIYALAVVFFEMFTGRLPFVADAAMAVILSHIREPPPSPTSINPALPAVIERIVLRGMAKQPEDRFQSVSELREELEAASSRVEPTAA